MTPHISLKHITKTFGRGRTAVTAIDHITLDVAPGEFFVFVGPSGSGKSTLLRIMSGLDKDFHGTLEWAPEIKSQDISFVFQQFALLPWLTVFENVELGLKGRNVPQSERHTLVMKELETFGLAHFAHTYPRSLSGGMKQRVGIARALVTNPKIIFMDEPFSELDSFIAEELRQELLEVWRKRRMTVVMVTHIVPEALELADRIAILSPRPAHIIRIVENTLTRPRPKRTDQFFKLEDEITKIIRS